MAASASSAPPGSRADWFQDPNDPRLIRYWDGRTWTAYSLPKPEDWDPASRGNPVVWWQTWWVVLFGLLLCAPVGLVGLWRRPGVSTGLRTGLTLAVVVLFGVVILTDDNSAPSRANAPASKPESTFPTSSPKATPEETEPLRSVVPDVTGLARRQAERRLAAAGLVVENVREIPSELPPGTVLRQSKKVGASLLAGTSVTLMVAVPYPSVPDVVGRVKSVAVKLLQRAGFKVKLTTETRTSGESGVVLSQTPAGAERAKPSSLITVVVSSVVRPVAQPPAQNCTPGYRPCLTPASDYDCAGGSGDGPKYAYGPIYVSGYDPYDLDADGNGVACEF